MSLNTFNDSIIDGICVYKKKDELFEAMIKRFKRKVNKSGILKEYKDKMEYVKPSIAKKKKILESKRRIEIEKNKIEKQTLKNKKRHRGMYSEK